MINTTGEHLELGHQPACEWSEKGASSHKRIPGEYARQ